MGIGVESFTNVDGAGPTSIAVREQGVWPWRSEERSGGIGESLLLFRLLSIEVVLLVVVAAAGMVHEVEGPPVEVGGEGVVTHLGVDHGGALEAVDDVGELGEQACAGGEGVVEASGVGQIDGGVGQGVESVVIVDGQPVRQGLDNVGGFGGLGGFALLSGASLLGGQATFLIFFATAAGAGVVSSDRRHKVHDGRAAARCLVSCRMTGRWAGTSGSI